MDPTHLFELAIGMVMAIIALHYAAHRLRLPPSLALLAGGAALAFVPGLPTITVDPELVLVIFLPPLLMDGAWSIALGAAAPAHDRHRLACRRRGGVHLRRGGRGDASPVSVAALGGLRGAGRHRLAARRGRRPRRAAAGEAAAAPADPARGREPAQRCQRPGAVPLRRRRRRDRRLQRGRRGRQLLRAGDRRRRWSASSSARPGSSSCAGWATST